LEHSQLDIIQLQRNVANDRDFRSYEVLFKHFHKQLINFGASIVKSREAAEEVYSDVMLKIWDLGTSLNNINDLKIYLFTSVKNASLNYLAKYNKVHTVDIDSINLKLTHINTPEDHMLASEFHYKLYSAIQSLPTKAQLVFRLIKEDGFNYKQAAEILGISVYTVEGHMTNALKKLSISLRHYLISGNN
jgi:RNA polymerase sigma-70 factor (family 1)